MVICSRTGSWWTRIRILLGLTVSQPGTTRSPWVSRAITSGVQVQRLRLDVDDVVRRHAVAGDVHLLAVDQEMAVDDQLAGLAPGGREAGPVDDVVETRLEDDQQVVTGLAGEALGLLVVATELLLEHAVGVASLLLLLELQQVLATPWCGRGRACPAGRRDARRPCRCRPGLCRTGGTSWSWDRCNGPLLISPLRLRDLDATTLGRTAAVVGHRGDIGDGADLEPDRTRANGWRSRGRSRDP